MNKYNESDIYKILYNFFEETSNTEISDEIDQLINTTINENINKSIKNSFLYKLSRIVIIIISLGFLGTGIVFSYNIINSIFNNSTDSINTAVNNGIIQKIKH